MQSEGVFVSGSTHFLELINLVRVLFHTLSLDQISLGVIKLVAGTATSIVTTYPELPPLSSGHMHGKVLYKINLCIIELITHELPLEEPLLY